MLHCSMTIYMQTLHKVLITIALIPSMFFMTESRAMQGSMYPADEIRVEINSKRKKPCSGDEVEDIESTKRTCKKAELPSCTRHKKKLVMAFFPNDVANIVCEYMLPTNEEIKEGGTLLTSAIQENNEAGMIHAIDVGADIDGKVSEELQKLAPDYLYQGITFLSYATRKGPKIAKCLLDHNANPNIPDIYGLSPLHHVQDVETVELLLQYKADIYAVDKEQNSILHIVIGFPTSIASPLVQALIRHGVPLEHKNNQGQTALHKAPRHQDNSIVLSLLQAKSNACTPDRGGNSPLHSAMRYFRPAVNQYNGNNGIVTVITLINASANPFTKNKRGQSPIDMALNNNIKNAMIEAYEKKQSEHSENSYN